MKRATIGASARVRGRIAGDEDLVVLGRVEGEIELRGALEIDAGAVVRAKVRAQAVRVAGVVIGDVTALDLLHLEPTARVIGDLRAGRLVIEPGARVSGGVSVEEARTELPRRTFEGRRALPEQDVRPVRPVERPAPSPPRRPDRPTLEPEIEPTHPGRSTWAMSGRPSQEVEAVIDSPPRASMDSARRRVTVRMKSREES